MKRKPRTRSVQSKALTFGGPAVTWQWGLPGTTFDYAGEVKDGLKSSVVVAALNWIMRAFPEAPAVVEKREAEQWRATEHDLADLLRAPNPFYGGRVLWMATAMDFCFGEAFWHKIRNGLGQVVELWWIPRALITPKWDDNKFPGVFITHYEYNVNGKLFILPPEDVVHFRFGMDPENIRRGWSQLAAVFREVYVDDQASNFTASILRNLGIIGLVFSPATGAAPIPPGKLAEFKEYVQTNFTGDKRGTAMAFSQPTKAEVLAYNLNGLDMGPIRDISEERVCAALGIPAAVIGFGTGLQQTKVGATMREMIQLAWRGSIMPTQEIIADELDRSLLPEFQKNTGLFRVKFDASQVRALWEDEKEKAERLAALVAGGVIMLSEGRAPLGFEVRDEHKVYYRPSNVTAVKTPGEKIEPPKASPEPDKKPEEKVDDAA